jgi:Ca2+-binding EF-hand superfamily protein
MNKLLIGGAAAALAVAIAPAAGQPAPPPPPGVAQGTTPVPGAPPARLMHMRGMADRVMTRDEVAQHVRKLFARLDKNHDGFLTKDEIDAMHQKMMGMHAGVENHPGEHRMPTPDRAAMFDKLDANHDGNISRQEFMAAQPQLHERRVMIFRNGPDGGPRAPGTPGMKMHMRGMGGFGGHLFEMADSNHDGRVSLQEAEAAALAHFDRADVNHDGKLTPEERRQAHQPMRGDRRPS